MRHVTEVVLYEGDRDSILLLSPWSGFTTDTNAWFDIGWGAPPNNTSSTDPLCHQFEIKSRLESCSPDPWQEILNLLTKHYYNMHPLTSTTNNEYFTSPACKFIASALLRCTTFAAVATRFAHGHIITKIGTRQVGESCGRVQAMSRRYQFSKL